MKQQYLERCKAAVKRFQKIENVYRDFNHHINGASSFTYRNQIICSNVSSVFPFTLLVWVYTIGHLLYTKNYDNFLLYKMAAVT